jgi:hypothetical protein
MQKAGMYISIVGGGLLIGGTLLPMWASNGIAVTGWDGDYLSIGRWVLLVAALVAVCTALVAVQRKPPWLGLSGMLGLVQASLIVWRGYKLQAIGIGAWVLLLGAIMILLAAVLLRTRTAPKD